MPVIYVEGPKMNKEQKEELIKTLTEKSAQILNLPTQAFTVVINEHDPDNVGVGGELLSKRLAK
ncbi:MAG TPA: 4-oxalocrotonate tautomerase [Clostridia bacterium]|jgi:4-oxalocrotonate tautomerase|nr:4-oxalocrotonate tautomerase [Clostridia bacterium]